MLLFVVLIIDPSFLHILLGERGFSSLHWSQTSNCFSLVAECHLIVLRCFHKPTTSLFFSLLVFQQLRSILLCKDAFQVHLWQKLSFSSPSLYPNNLASILSFRRHCDVALFTHHLVLSRSCYFLAYPFNRSVVFSFKFFHLLKFCLYFQPQCCLKSFLAIVPFFQ